MTTSGWCCTPSAAVCAQRMPMDPRHAVHVHPAWLSPLDSVHAFSGIAFHDLEYHDVLKVLLVTCHRSSKLMHTARHSDSHLICDCIMHKTCHRLSISSHWLTVTQLLPPSLPCIWPIVSAAHMKSTLPHFNVKTPTHKVWCPWAFCVLVCSGTGNRPVKSPLKLWASRRTLGGVKSANAGPFHQQLTLTF